MREEAHKGRMCLKRGHLNLASLGLVFPSFCRCALRPWLGEVKNKSPAPQPSTYSGFLEVMFAMLVTSNFSHNIHGLCWYQMLYSPALIETVHSLFLSTSLQLWRVCVSENWFSDHIYLWVVAVCLCCSEVMLCSSSCVFSGSGGVPTGWEERAGKYETGPGEADQNAGVRPQTGEVRPIAPGSSCLLSIQHAVIMFCEF